MGTNYRIKPRGRVNPKAGMLCLITTHLKEFKLLGLIHLWLPLSAFPPTRPLSNQYHSTQISWISSKCFNKNASLTSHSSKNNNTHIDHNLRSRQHLIPDIISVISITLFDKHTLNIITITLLISYVPILTSPTSLHHPYHWNSILSFHLSPSPNCFWTWLQNKVDFVGMTTMEL